VEGDGVVRWPGARIGKEVVPVQGEDGVKERAEDMVGGGRGLETAKPVERKGHCLPDYIPEGPDCGIVPRLRGRALPAIS
jgi:hypothetical protein